MKVADIETLILACEDFTALYGDNPGGDKGEAILFSVATLHSELNNVLEFGDVGGHNSCHTT